ncbi:hypothetical protein PTTG_29378 [Puccinia triticina 1-1 BBBD Race 1]|uniref:Uncharacterized protein n=1 Tax=Puccinia triticina (isolate 1-1 / race 1 (BBBD)) TaxID=630390 RepID=A0A180G6R3_PUCT1|nr:hypothetical protein PTTG_29378 [Puccinia triticina 1-1 BBBD Race 1]
MAKRLTKRLNKSQDVQVAPGDPIQGAAEVAGAGDETGRTAKLGSTGGGVRENLSNDAVMKDAMMKGKDTTHDSDSEDSFKEIPNPVKEGQIADTASRYKSILLNLPLIVEPEEVTLIEPAVVKDKVADTAMEVVGTVPGRVDQDKTDRQEIWDCAQEAFANGDKKSTDFFLRLYGKMDNNTSLSAPDKPDILRSSLSDAVNPAVNVVKRPVDKTTIVFIKGSLPNHFDVGFTPYFDRNIREFRGPIPLTIFDKNWQQDAIHYYTNRRTRGDEKDGNYIGYEYPNEWTQSFSKWTTNHQNFYITFRDMYGYKEFAEWILVHKENVDKIVGEEGFMTAFRYNMIVQQNAFFVSSYGYIRRDFCAWRITSTLGENDETNNPYAIGAKKFGFDPNTGKQRVKLQKGGDEQLRHESSSGHGRGGHRGRGFGERWGQDRRNSDYGGYHDYHQEEHINKRPRDFGYGDNQAIRGHEYGGHQSGYNRDHGGFGRERDQGSSRGFKKKENSSLVKDKEN